MASGGKRKDNGSGTIYQNEKTKYWCAEVNWTDSSGNRRKKKFSGKSKSVVKAKLDEFKKELIISGPDIGKKSISFQDYAENWLKLKLKNSLKPTSHLRVDVTLRNQVYPYIGNIQIESIESEDIQKMINDLIAEGKSFSTIKKAYDAVNSCLRDYRVTSKKSGSHNPCEAVVLPIAKKKDPSDIIWYEEDERKKIRAEATRCYSNGKSVYRLGHALVVLMYTGMRIGELIALTWDDIDFENKTISITKNAVVVAADEDEDTNYKMIVQKDTKTYSGKREIRMTEIAKESLLKIREFNGAHKYVMSTSTGKQIGVRNVERNFHSVLVRTGLIDEDDGRCGVHALRHTFASMLFNNGCSVKLVSEILGHTDTKITENIYIHLIQKQKVKAMEDIDKYSS